MNDRLPHEKGFHVSWDQLHRDARALAWRLQGHGPEDGGGADCTLPLFFRPPRSVHEAQRAPWSQAVHCSRAVFHGKPRDVVTPYEEQA